MTHTLKSPTLKNRHYALLAFGLALLAASILFIPFILLLILTSCKKDSLKNYTNPQIESIYFNEHDKIENIEDLSFTVDTIAGII